MNLNFLIAPDFPPQYFGGWHFLNTRLQHLIDGNVHLMMPANEDEERKEIDSDKVDLIYANPFDAAKLIREMGYLPVARPMNQSDEMVIMSAADSPIKQLTDLKPGMRVLCTDNFDVKLIGLRLLEAVDLEESDLEWIKVDAFQAVAKQLILNKAEMGFFMARAFHSLTKITTDRLNLLIESRIHDLSHILLLHSRHAQYQETLQKAFADMKNTPVGKQMLMDLGLNDGFEILRQEDAEFLIDLIETLRD